MPVEPGALRPPKEHDYVRWHWLKDHTGELQPAYWSNGQQFWCPWNSRTQFGLGDMWFCGFRYHGPCTPDAIVVDPEDETMIELICRAYAKEVRCSFVNQSWPFYKPVARAIITALRDAARGAGG